MRMKKWFTGLTLLLVLALTVGTACAAKLTDEVRDAWNAMGGTNNGLREFWDDVEEIWGSGRAGLYDALDELFDDDDDDDDWDDRRPSVFSGEPIAVELNGSQVSVHTDFKETMDAYEALMQRFIPYMETVQSGNYQVDEYVSLLAEYEKTTEIIDNIGDMELSRGDDAYFRDVQQRVKQSLREAIGK